MDIVSDEKGTIGIEGEMAVIKLPLSQIHALRVALMECPCKSAKTNSTVGIRVRLEKALARLEAAK